MQHSNGKPQNVVNFLAFDDFLSRNLLSERDFEHLKKRQLAPATVEIRGRLMVSRRAERAWIAMMEGRKANRRPLHRQHH